MNISDFQMTVGSGYPMQQLQEAKMFPASSIRHSDLDTMATSTQRAIRIYCSRSWKQGAQSDSKGISYIQ